MAKVVEVAQIVRDSSGGQSLWRQPAEQIASLEQQSFRRGQFGLSPGRVQVMRQQQLVVHLHAVMHEHPKIGGIACLPATQSGRPAFVCLDVLSVFQQHAMVSLQQVAAGDRAPIFPRVEKCDPAAHATFAKARSGESVNGVVRGQ